jgi:hypothetical protein
VWTDHNAATGSAVVRRTIPTISPGFQQNTAKNVRKVVENLRGCLKMF